MSTASFSPATRVEVTRKPCGDEVNTSVVSLVSARAVEAATASRRRASAGVSSLVSLVMARVLSRWAGVGRPTTAPRYPPGATPSLSPELPGEPPSQMRPRPAEGNEPHQTQEQHEREERQRAWRHAREQRRGDRDGGEAEEAGRHDGAGRVALGIAGGARSGALTLSVEPAPMATKVAAEEVEAHQRDGLPPGGGEPDGHRRPAVLGTGERGGGLRAGDPEDRSNESDGRETGEGHEARAAAILFYMGEPPERAARHLEGEAACCSH